VQTKAERDGDEWIINGQKVWTSGLISAISAKSSAAQTAAPETFGPYCVYHQYEGSGVEVRPLRQMTGGSSFNEVFLTNVRVADDHRLSGINHGWSVALTTLSNERASIGAGSSFAGPGSRTAQGLSPC